MTAAWDQGAFEIWNQPTRTSQCRWRVVQLVLAHEQQHWDVHGAQFVIGEPTIQTRNTLMLMRSHSPIHGVARLVCSRGASKKISSER